MDMDADIETTRKPLSSVPPSFRVAALASVAGLRDSCGHIPLHACVPVIAEGAVAHALDGATNLVLFNIDGEQSVQDISARTQIPLSETIAACLDLVARGVVSIEIPPGPEEARE